MWGGAKCVWSEKLVNSTQAINAGLGNLTQSSGWPVLAWPALDWQHWGHQELWEADSSLCTWLWLGTSGRGYRAISVICSRVTRKFGDD